MTIDTVSKAILHVISDNGCTVTVTDGLLTTCQHTNEQFIIKGSSGDTYFISTVCWLIGLALRHALAMSLLVGFGLDLVSEDIAA